MIRLIPFLIFSDLLTHVQIYLYKNNKICLRSTTICIHTVLNNVYYFLVIYTLIKISDKVKLKCDIMFDIDGNDF